MSNPSSSAESLRDPKTGKCCPNRCGAVVNRVNSTVNSLVNQVLGSLSDRVGRVEEKLSEKCSDCKEKLSEKTSTIEKRLNDIYRAVQTSILQNYAQLRGRTEELLQQSPTETPTETPEELPSPTEAESETPLPTPTKGGSSASSASKPGGEARSQMPQSPTSQSGQPKTPQGTSKGSSRRSSDCLEIDWCEDFYIWLNQWQEAQVKVQQQNQESYRECCLPTLAQRQKQQDENEPRAIGARGFEGEIAKEG